MTPAISVVIPTFRRTYLLYRCLVALTSHEPGPACEILVVDDGRSTTVRAMVKALARQYGSIRYLVPPAGRRGPEVRRAMPAEPTDAERDTAGPDGAEFVTANCFVRRDALARAGGFDERYTRAWREDSDLYFTLIEQGEKVVTAPQAVVIHPARTFAATDCLRRHRNLYFDALLYKKHPRLYREKIAAGPPGRD